MAKKEQKCSIDGCEKIIRSIGLCLSHYNSHLHKKNYKLKPKPKCLCGKTIGHNSKRGLCTVCKKEADRDKDNLRAKKYFQQNKQVIAIKKKQKYTDDMVFRISAVLRSRLNTAIVKNTKTGSAVRDLGCSIKELLIHLENQFEPGMNWQNYGHSPGSWNIDHIIPVSSLDLTKVENIKIICNYSNLRPMWASNNYSRGNKNGT